jgi:hypothetical protein
LIEYLVRWSDGGREILVVRVTPFGEEIIWVASSTEHPCLLDSTDDVQDDFEHLLDSAQEVAWRDAGQELSFYPVDPNVDALILLRTGDVFVQLVG